MALIGNKVDLNHMQAVKQDQHCKFAASRKMKAFYCSAKTGDQVDNVFHQIASELSGVVLSKSTADIMQKKVRAEIIEHGDRDTNEMKPEDKLQAHVKNEKGKKGSS